MNRTKTAARTVARLGSAAALAALAATGSTRAARADSVAQLEIYKRLTAETIALIDPQGGTSSGGASTNVKYAVGDILTFRIAFTPVPNGATRGLGGYITEYVPANTEVVGARLTDKTGTTVAPHRGGLGALGWGPRGAEGYAAPLSEGGIASLYADTGAFYSTDPRTARDPADAFPTIANGIVMSPAPTGAGQFDQLLGITTNTYYAHNAWDFVQVRAFGVSSGALGNGTGNTPFGYGSAVAGPESFFSFEATETQPNVIQAASVVGPWKRILAPGAELGSGVVATAVGPAGRPGVPTSLGWVLTQDNPLPAATNAVRYAVGELVVGDEYYAEISLRVKGSPLDPVMNDDVNCAEVFGGDASSRKQDGTDGGKDNTWRYFVPSASCVKLDLRFELDVDKVMALPNDLLTYTLTTQNLSLNPRTNVVVSHDLSTTGALSLVSATGAPAVAGDVLTWPAVDLQPGDTVVQTIVTQVSGGGASTTSVANYSADQLAAPGFTVQTLSNIQPIANLDLSMAAVPAITSAGSTVTYTATIANAGTGVATMAGCNAPCGLVVNLPAGFTYVPGSTKFDAVAAADPAVAADVRWTAGVPDVQPGQSLTLTFDAAIAANEPTGAYLASLETWFRDPGAGKNIEDAISSTAQVLVGLLQSDAPVVTAPLFAGGTQVCGTSTEPNGTTIVVYVDLLPAGTTTVNGGTWCAPVPTLYAGQDVTATAENSGAGEFVSSPSAPPVEVQGVSAMSPCNDGADNDGDGLVDFPADPGCSSALDPDETDIPACSDGIDNDGDGFVDYPDDTSCASFLDDDEAGPPACGDGVDNDGDGLVDFPDDLGCDAVDDPSEADIPACANGVDDDGDGLADYPFDPGCADAHDDDETDGSGTGGAGGTGAGGSGNLGGGGSGSTGGSGNGTPPDLGGVPAQPGDGSGEDSGCGCRVAGGREAAGRSAFALVLVLASAAASRRRHRSRPRI